LKARVVRPAKVGASLADLSKLLDDFVVVRDRRAEREVVVHKPEPSAVDTAEWLKKMGGVK
jgi:hypothetical protein